MFSVRPARFAMFMVCKVPEPLAFFFYDPDHTRGMFNHKAVSLFITAVFILGACYHDRTARVQNKRICIAVQGVFSSLYADLHRAERTRASNPYIRAEPKGCGLSQHSAGRYLLTYLI